MNFLKKLFFMGILGPALLQAQSQYADCQQDDFVFVENESVQVRTSGMSYSPKCLKVRPGTEVTITASRFHPLQAAEDFDVLNPFFSEFDHTRAQTRVLEEEGSYGYFCVDHVRDPLTGSGMAGLIVVEDF